MKKIEIYGNVYNLDHIKSFEIQESSEGMAELTVVYSFQRKENSHDAVSIDWFNIILKGLSILKGLEYLYDILNLLPF